MNTVTCPECGGDPLGLVCGACGGAGKHPDGVFTCGVCGGSGLAACERCESKGHIETGEEE